MMAHAWPRDQSRSLSPHKLLSFAWESVERKRIDVALPLMMSTSRITFRAYGQRNALKRPTITWMYLLVWLVVLSSLSTLIQNSKLYAFAAPSSKESMGSRTLTHLRKSLMSVALGLNSIQSSMRRHTTPGKMVTLWWLKTLCWYIRAVNSRTQLPSSTQIISHRWRSPSWTATRSRWSTISPRTAHRMCVSKVRCTSSLWKLL